MSRSVVSQGLPHDVFKYGHTCMSGGGDIRHDLKQLILCSWQAATAEAGAGVWRTHVHVDDVGAGGIVFDVQQQLKQVQGLGTLTSTWMMSVPAASSLISGRCSRVLKCSGNPGRIRERLPTAPPRPAAPI